MEILQNRKKHRVRGTRCEPPETWDYCIRLHGDPLRVGRCLSKREWERDDTDALDVDRLRERLRPTDD